MQNFPSESDIDEANAREPSVVVRYIGLIKALSIIMAVLIVAAFAVIVVTIYSRLQAGNGSHAVNEIDLVLPTGAYVSAASLGKSGMVLVLDMPDQQQVWRLTGNGRVTQKIILRSD